jgi:hypothetical protein
MSFTEVGITSCFGLLAYLRLTARISEHIFSPVRCGSQSAVSSPLGDAGQTVLESILVCWWT